MLRETPISHWPESGDTLLKRVHPMMRPPATFFEPLYAIIDDLYSDDGRRRNIPAKAWRLDNCSIAVIPDGRYDSYAVSLPEKFADWLGDSMPKHAPIVYENLLRFVDDVMPFRDRPVRGAGSERFTHGELHMLAEYRKGGPMFPRALAAAYVLEAVCMDTPLGLKEVRLRESTNRGVNRVYVECRRQDGKIDILDPHARITSERRTGQVWPYALERGQQARAVPNALGLFEVVRG